MLLVPFQAWAADLAAAGLPIMTICGFLMSLLSMTPGTDYILQTRVVACLQSKELLLRIDSSREIRRRQDLRRITLMTAV
jgi:putative intracellular protease/amidase